MAGTPNNAKDTGKKISINYAIGAVSGRFTAWWIMPLLSSSQATSRQPRSSSVHTQSANKLTLKSLRTQATLCAHSSSFVLLIALTSSQDGTGLIGLGPNSGSNVWTALKPDPAAVTFLDSIFAQNTSTPNFMTIILGRTEDPTDVFPGDFTIGEVHPNYTDVTNAPKLLVTDVPLREQGDQHFQILLDKDGLLGPDGQALKIKTKVDDTKDDYQPTAIIDTGFSLSQVPKHVADGIYSRYTGAEFMNVSGIGATWIVPCEMEVNITFTVGGQQFPIHPLDATL